MVYLLKMVDHLWPIELHRLPITDFPGDFLSRGWPPEAPEAPWQADFACDVGFVRQVGSTECVFGGAEMMPERPAFRWRWPGEDPSEVEINSGNLT